MDEPWIFNFRAYDRGAEWKTADGDVCAVRDSLVHVFHHRWADMFEECVVDGEARAAPNGWGQGIDCFE